MNDTNCVLNELTKMSSIDSTFYLKIEWKILYLYSIINRCIEKHIVRLGRVTYTKTLKLNKKKIVLL